MSKYLVYKDETGKEKIFDGKIPHLEEDIYSTTEQCIGKWRDGKLLYRRNFYVNDNSVFTANADLNILSNLNIDNLAKIDFKFTYTRADNKVQYSVFDCFYLNNTDYFIIFYTDMLHLRLGSSQANATNKSLELTIYYTKKAD